MTLDETLKFLQNLEPDKEFRIENNLVMMNNYGWVAVTQQYIESACMRWLKSNYNKESPQMRGRTDAPYNTPIYFKVHEYLSFYSELDNTISIDNIIALSLSMDENND